MIPVKFNKNIIMKYLINNINIKIALYLYTDLIYIIKVIDFQQYKKGIKLPFLSPKIKLIN